MNDSIDSHAIYFHVRIVMGIVVGLALTHLLRGVARVIEHPRNKRPYWVHFVWVAWMFAYLIHFWWWELWFSLRMEWTFGIYFFLILYSLLLYLTAALIFPEQMADFDDYQSYFYSRRSWFFGALATVFVVDFADTWLKGADYVAHLGPEYPWRNLCFIALCVVAAITGNARFHAIFAIGALAYQVSWIVRIYDVFG